MNAVEKALRHIEKLMARRASPRPSPQRKPAKRGLKSPRKKRSEKPRVVSKGRRHTSAKREYNPPVTQPDVSELEQTFAPAPTPPEHVPGTLDAVFLDEPDVEGPITPAFPRIGESFTRAGEEHGAYPVKLQRPSWAEAFERAGPKPEPVVAPSSGTFRGSCKAIDADTGRQCRLLAGHTKPHRHERGEFTRVLQSGGVPLLHQRLDSFATRRDVPELLETRGSAAEQRASRERLAKGVRLRTTSATPKADIEPGTYDERGQRRGT